MENKKLGILKLLSIVFLVVVALTWFIKTGAVGTTGFTLGDHAPLGFFDLIRIPLGTTLNFIHVGLLIITIGGFYGIVNETGVYTKIVKSVESKLGNKFLIISMITLMLLSALTGLSFLLVVLVPFLATILLKQGFDKITVMAATLGSILIGNIGALYSTNITTPVKYYFQFGVNSQIVAKLLMLVIAGGLYTFYVYKRSIKKKVAKKDLDIPLFEDKTSKTKSALPLVLVLVIGFIFMVVAMYDWLYTWDINFFKDLHETLPTLTVFNFPIVSNLIGNVNYLGGWSIYDLSIVLILLSGILTWVYGIKKEVAVEKFFDGVKKMIKPAIYVVLANIVFYAIQVTQGDANIFYTIGNAFMEISTKFNIVVSTIVAFIGGIFYPDFMQYSNVFARLAAVSSIGTNSYPIFALVLQFINGVSMMILPTSSLLIFGLVYFDISFKEWAGYIWKILLQIFAIALIIIILANMFI